MEDTQSSLLAKLNRLTQENGDLKNEIEELKLFLQRRENEIRNLEREVDRKSTDPKYVLMTKQQNTDQVIRYALEQEIARPEDWCVTDAAVFSSINNGNYPSYGSCQYCMASGPLGFRCVHCQRNNTNYMIFEFNGRIFDSQKIGKLFGRTHLKMVSGYKFCMEECQSRTYSLPMLKMAYSRKFDHDDYSIKVGWDTIQFVLENGKLTKT